MQNTPHTTRMLITLQLEAGDSISGAIEELPDYVIPTFSEVSPNVWVGEFPVSCEVAPELAEGDFADDLMPYLGEFLLMKSVYRAKFEIVVAVGHPAADHFTMPSHYVAFAASLGASVSVRSNRVLPSPSIASM